VLIDPIELTAPATAHYKLGLIQASKNGVPFSKGTHGMSIKRPTYSFRQAFGLEKIDRTQKTTIEIRIQHEKSTNPEPPYADIRECLQITLNKSEGIPIAD